MSKEIAPHFSASDVSNVKKFSRRKKVFVFNLTFVLPPQNFHRTIIPSLDVLWFNFILDLNLCSFVSNSLS